MVHDAMTEQPTEGDSKLFDLARAVAKSGHFSAVYVQSRHRVSDTIAWGMQAHDEHGQDWTPLLLRGRDLATSCWKLQQTPEILARFIRGPRSSTTAIITSAKTVGDFDFLVLAISPPDDHRKSARRATRRALRNLILCLTPKGDSR